MPGGRKYVTLLTIGTKSIFSGNGDPNGSLSGLVNDLYIQADGSGGIWRNLDGATAWAQDASVETVTSINNADSPYTVLPGDAYVICNAVAGPITATLPAIGTTGRTIQFVKTDASANEVTIDGNGAETINGAANQPLTSIHEAAIVHDNGTDWTIGFPIPMVAIGDLTVAVGETRSYRAGRLTGDVTNGGTLDGVSGIVTGDFALTNASITRWFGDITGNVTLTGTANAVIYGNVTGDIDAADGTTVTVHGDVVGATESNASGTIRVYGTVTGASTGTGTERVFSDRVMGMWTGPGTARTVNEYTILTTDIVPHDIDATGGAVELNLPTAASWIAANPDIPFIRISAVNIANAATVDPNGAETINAAALYTFATAYDSIDLYPVSGTGWVIR